MNLLQRVWTEENGGSEGIGVLEFESSGSEERCGKTYVEWRGTYNARFTEFLTYLWDAEGLCKRIIVILFSVTDDEYKGEENRISEGAGQSDRKGPK